MIGDLKPYADYKASGLPWLGQVPAQWRVVRNGSLFGQRSQTGYAELPILEVSLKTGVQVRSFGGAKRKQVMSDFGKYKRAAKGDLAYNTMRMWQGALGICPVDGLVSPAYVVARPYPEVVPEYFAALFRTGDYMAEIDAASRGIVKDRNRLYWDQFKQMQSPCPPPDEQAAIVRFLAWANGRLDRAIRAKRKVVALLTEQKQAIIFRAVTKGFDAGAPLNSTAIPWLGDIPAHWELRRLRTLVHAIDQGVSPLAAGFLAEGDSWGVLKSGCVNRGVFRETEHKRLASEFVVEPSIVVAVGDVLISRACGSPSLVGSVGRVRSIRYRLILSDKTFRARFRDTVDPDFMVYAMNSRYYRHQVEQAISGAEGMANNLPLSSLKDFRFAIPPVAEARHIARRIDVETAAIEKSIERLEGEIELVREFRTRLVADIVTGRLDVRDAAAQLPADVPTGTEADLDNESDELEPLDEEAAEA
ncbi:MAG: restriction endonuclease subunit S [Zoogloea sp.]|nr:restriction endonuclease subunit S [Zoogloea sp.]